MERCVLFGVGNTALNVARVLQNSCTIFGTTRSAEKSFELRSKSIEPIVVQAGSVPPKSVIDDSFVLVSFPPDGSTDRLWSEVCSDARNIVYISSTGIYGKTSGVINEDSSVDADSPHSKLRLDAENIWLSVGATVLRCPGLYGPESGMHLRLKNGGVKIPGDGTNFVSRIHFEDLANIVVECFKHGTNAQLYVVGDLEPSTHLDSISYVCAKMNLPLPDSAPLTEVNPTLRGNRRIDSSKLRSELGITLKYSSYREGYDAILG